MNKDVVVIGNSTLDVVWSVTTAVRSGMKHVASAVRGMPGGQAANAAVTMAGLGLAVRYLGIFGDDSGGAISRVAFADANVSLEGSAVATGHAHPHAIIMVGADGDRTIAMYKDPEWPDFASDVDLSHVARARLLYLDGHEPHLAVAAAEIAKRHGVPMVMDAEVVTPELELLVRAASCLIAPSSIISELAGGLAVPEALAQLSSRHRDRTVIATMGAEGAIGRRCGASVTIPASPCIVNDTTGAGDAFHGAYVAADLSGYDLPEAMRFAGRVAAAVCEVEGPRLSIARLMQFRNELVPR